MSSIMVWAIALLDEPVAESAATAISAPLGRVMGGMKGFCASIDAAPVRVAAV
jgi:hypothetical protein